MSLLDSQGNPKCAITLDDLASLRGDPVQAPALPKSCAPIAEILSVRERSREWFGFLEEAFSKGTYCSLLTTIWLRSRMGDRMALRLLVNLLEVRYSGLELIQDSLRPSQMIRMHMLRKTPGRRVVSVIEKLEHLSAQVGLRTASLQGNPLSALDRLESVAQERLQQLLVGALPAEGLSWLRQLLEGELAARAHRLQLIAERVGAYDSRRIARVLPLLSQQEERIRDTQDLIVRFPDVEVLKTRTPALLNQLTENNFFKLLTDLEEQPGGRELAHVLRLLHRYTPATADLMFSSGVLRYIDQKRQLPGTAPLDPARSILVALHVGGADACLKVSMSKELGRKCGWLSAGLQLKVTGDTVTIQYRERLHSSFLHLDGVPEIMEEVSSKRENIRDMVMANVGNESLLCGLLGTPQVFGAPGLIEAVANRSRSVKVLLEIANRRELHSGQANRNVPLVLLEHPSAIPLGSVRKFVHVRYVPKQDLMSLANRGSRVRPEIRHLCASYMATLGV